MKNFFAKFKKALFNPKKAFLYALWALRKLRVRKVVKNGEWFYEYKGELYPAYLNEGNAASSIVEKAKAFCKGKGIDVGSSAWPFPGATPIQDEPHQNAYKLDAFSDNSLDYVFSSHCVEHLDRWQDALKLWIRKLKPGGTLFLYIPHQSMKLWSPGGPWVGHSHKWVPTHEAINAFLEKNGVGIIDYNPDKDRYWSFHIVGKKK